MSLKAICGLLTPLVMHHGLWTKDTGGGTGLINKKWLLFGLEYFHNKRF